MAGHLGNELDFAFSRLPCTIGGTGASIGGTMGGIVREERRSDVSHDHQHMIDIRHIRDGVERVVH